MASRFDSVRQRKAGPVLLLAVLVLIAPVGAPGLAAEDLAGYLFPRTLHRLIDLHHGQSGAYVLEKGEEALLVRTWMVENAVEKLDLLTFIWTLDNIGMIATEALLRAAERGVTIRVVVDDMVLREEDLGLLLALAHHPNLDIRIYNPVETVGVSTLEMLGILATDFRRFNHRLHNKTFIADGLLAMTGGRNVANEYFDYDQEYNFRDREIMVVGPVVEAMACNFELYWNSGLAHPIEELLPERYANLSPGEVREVYAELHACAESLIGHLPVLRFALENTEERMAEILRRMVWTEDIWFVSDLPGKNLGKPGLGGGGEMAEALRRAIAGAGERITIQSPYLVMEEDAMGLYRKLLDGVEVRISTNSLASTDNIPAFSGYLADRKDLLDAGFLIREFRPNPAIERDLVERYLGPEMESPIFVLHAKSLVVDGELTYIGTFNLDPRSVHLNTEEGVFVRHRDLAQQVERQIEEEMLQENSWDPRLSDPNAHAGWWRRVRLWFYRLLPIRALL